MNTPFPRFQDSRDANLIYVLHYYNIEGLIGKAAIDHLSVKYNGMIYGIPVELFIFFDTIRLTDYLCMCEAANEAYYRPGQPGRGI